MEGALGKLKKRWPKPLSKEASHLFEEIKLSLRELKKKKGVSAKSPEKKNFDFIKLMSQLLKTHDILFLNRHLSYHVLAKADLPRAYGSEEEAMAVLSELLSVTARHSSFGSKLEISIQAANLREGPAVQTRFSYEGDPLSDLDRQKLLENLYGLPGEGGGETSGIADTRNILRHVGGQFWIEFPKETCVALTFNWPAFEKQKTSALPKYGTYKYDIWLTDYLKLRQRFGIPKTEKLMTQVESFAKSLVRDPIDIVVSFLDQGMMTVIYEAQEGSAQSVATRLSQRLAREPFRIGKSNLVPKFRYQLTFLA